MILQPTDYPLVAIGAIITLAMLILNLLKYPA